jgi:hypothetical protein
VGEVKAEGAALALAGSLAVEGFKLVRDYMPDLSEVRRAEAGDVTIVADARAAELQGAVIVVVVGGVVSYLAKSPAPLVAGVVGLSAAVVLYEWQLRRRPVEAAAVAGEPPGGLTAELVREGGRRRHEARCPREGPVRLPGSRSRRIR